MLTNNCPYEHSSAELCEREYCLACFCQEEGCTSKHLNLWDGCLMNEKHLKKRSCCRLLGCPCRVESCSEKHGNSGTAKGRPRVTSTALLRLQFLSLQLERSQAARRDPSLI